MAECEKMMQLCEAAVDGALTPEEQETLDRHLAECPACAAYLADLRFLASTMGETLALPDGLHKKVMSSIEEEAHRTAIVQTHRPNHRRLPVFTMMAAAAACVALVFSGAMDGLMNVRLDGRSSGGGNMENSGMSRAASDQASPAETQTQGSVSAQTTEGMAADSGAETDAGADAGSNTYSKDAGYYKESGEDAPQLFTAGAPESSTAAPEPYAARSAELPEENAAQAPAAEQNAAEKQDYAMAPEAAAGNSETISGRSMPSESGRTRDELEEPEEQPLPQVGTFISNVMSDEIFAACYLVEGGSGLPDLGQAQQRDSSFAYYVTDNNLAQLETLLDSLEKAGCTVGLYEESGVIFNATAKRVILIVRLE